MKENYRPLYQTVRVDVRPSDPARYAANGWKNYYGSYTDGSREYNCDQVRHDAHLQPYIERYERCG